MENHKEAVASANGIFYSKQNDEFCCSICTFNGTCKDQREHEATPCHVRTLERFNLIFTASAAGIVCKVCGASLRWETLQTHAYWHKIVPWYKPADCYKTFFKNHVQEWESEFYCRLCDKFFPEWSTAYIHTKDDVHQNLLKERPAVNDFASWTANAVPYDTLVSEGFVSDIRNTTVKCTVCNCWNISLKNVQEHLKGQQHSQMKVQFGWDMRLLKLKKNAHLLQSAVIKKSPRNLSAGHSGNSENAPNSSCENMARIYVVEQSSYDFFCKICDLRFHSRTSVDLHIKETCHVAALEKYGCEQIWLKAQGYIYHCKCCECLVLGIKNVHQHVRGLRHKESLSELRSSSSGNKLNWNNSVPVTDKVAIKTGSAVEPGSHFLPDSHIQKLSSREFLCNLCNVVIPHVINIQNHLAGKRHVFGVKQLAENIVFTGGNDYHCKCCDCTIPGLENLYGHINGNRHAKSLSDPENRKEEPRNKNSVQIATPKPPETDSKSSAPPVAGHIEKSNKTESLRKECDETVSEEFNIQKHLEETNDGFIEKQSSETISLKGNNDYYCKCCNCTISGLDGLYLHMKDDSHAESLSALDQHESEANNKNSDQVETSRQSETATKTFSVKDDAMLPKDHIEKRGSKEFQCRLCNKAISSNSNIEKHLTSETHVSNAQRLSENISFMAGNNYHCRCCDCTIPGIENIYRHINGIRHAKILGNFVKHERTACKNIAEVKEPEKIARYDAKVLSYDHISKISHMTFCCKICNRIIPPYLNIDDHVAGKEHVESLKMFSAAIMTKESDKHFCRYCIITICGIDNVYMHLQESRHKSLARKSEEQKNASRFDYAAFQAELNAKMRPQKPKSAIPKIDSPPEPVICRYSGVSLPPTSDLHSHLAIHIGEDLSAFEEPDDAKETKEYVSTAEKKDQNDNLSQLTSGLKDSDLTELPNHGTKVLSDSLQSNGTTIPANHADSSNPASAGLVPANPTTNSEATRRSRRSISNMQRIAQFLNPEDDFIHDMRDKLRYTKLGLQLCSIKETKNVYCLICRKEVPETAQNYWLHLSTADHCENLEAMENDHALFELVPGQFSELDLVCQYMEEVSECSVHCHACDTNLKNTNMALRVHVNDERHKESSRKMDLRAREAFENVKPLLHCDWYTINKYWCVPCAEYFESELTFARHLRSTGHAILIRKSINGERALMHDFCSPCGLLWFGFRSTYANHCESTAHKWATWERNHESKGLGKIVKIFLAEMEQYVDCTIKHFDKLSVTQRDKEETLIRDLRMAVKSKFSDAKAFLFGSKASGFRTGDSDIEIFLDCGNMCDGVKSSECEALYFMTTVHHCLCKNSQSWDVDKTFTPCRSSVLKARHYVTGLTCEISFENELAVENMELIKYFNDIFPPCRKLILFLYQWLSLCGLAEPKGISNNALYWCMIFYLQKESSLPSVGSLIATKDRTQPIADRKVGVSFDFSRNEAMSSSLSMRELLINFFTFYAKFDYRYDVVSPMLGQVVKKRSFADFQSLPKEMAPYIDYMKNLDDPRSFRIDSAMCVQDPLILQRNLTEDTSKACMRRFRQCCLESLDVLRSAIDR